MTDKIIAIVLAAGRGKRMKSKTPKVLHPLLGQPLIKYPLKAIEDSGIKEILIVVGLNGHLIQEALEGKYHFIIQDPPQGTGDAISKALPYIIDNSIQNVLILPGDAPFITKEVILELTNHHFVNQADATILTTIIDKPYGYGRIVRESNGEFLFIVEEKDATPEQLNIKEINASVYLIKVDLLRKFIPSLRNNNVQKEYYLTDIFQILKSEGYKVELLTYLNDSSICLGVNSRKELAHLHKILKDKVCNELMENGVSIIDPSSTFIEVGVTIEADVTINPFTFISGNTTIKKGSKIGPMVMIKDSTIGENCIIYFSDLTNSVVEDNVNIGPFSHLRPETHIKQGAVIGNYAEIKKTTIGKGTKVHHVSYLGDASIGDGVNIGAGTIICNYDGQKKHPTKIEDGAFVGSNSTLVAPLNIGKESYIAAGSTITRDVPAEALALGREKQINKEKWVSKRRERKIKNG